jgi:hypothetical protein
MLTNAVSEGKELVEETRALADEDSDVAETECVLSSLGVGEAESLHRGTEQRNPVSLRQCKEGV